MHLTEPDEVYEDVTDNCKQPITAFVKGKEIFKPRTAFFTEFTLCEYALLAAASVIFKDPSTTSDDDVLELDRMVRR
jgi:hypothetical protein